MTNSDKASNPSGGVGAGSGVGKDARLSKEISESTPAKVKPPHRKMERAQGEVGVTRSSVEPEKREISGESRSGTWTHATQNSEGPEDGCEEGGHLFERIETPPKVRKLQRALYRKAKAEPKYRFYSLYGDLCRVDVIETAMRDIAGNGGAAGVDGETVEAFTRSDEAWNTWRENLMSELKSKAYQPSPVRRVWIPKADGKQRPLGIPTVKDRVVQAAMVVLLMPIFEADFHPQSYAYRPGKNTHHAIAAIQEALLKGQQEVIDADLSGYFDSIPHDRLIELVARRVSDGAVLKLIKAWLKAPIVEEDRKSGKKRTLPNERGTPQGGVISPLLANLYLDRLDKQVNEQCECRPTMVRYADDFVILCRKGQGAELLERLRRWLAARGLKLNEEKTRLVDSNREAFKFLGFEIRMQRHWRTRKMFPQARPHSKSCQKLRDKLRSMLNRWTSYVPEEEMIASVNRVIRGWGNYFHFGYSTKTFQKMQNYIEEKVARWLWRRHACSRGLFKHFEPASLHEVYGLWKLPLRLKWSQKTAKG